MVRSTDYTLKCCYPPEVAASIKLSWGQLMVAASPTGSCPLCCFLILLSVYIRKMMPWLLSSNQTIIFSLISSEKNLTTFCCSPNPSLLSYSISLFSLHPLPCSPPSLTSSSGKGLTRPSESSGSYIWELITLLWRLLVCRAESEKQREEGDRVSREYDQGRIWINHTVHRTPPWRTSSQ